MPKLWLAPLHGITVFHFRNCIYRHNSGLDAAVTPFVPVQPTEKLNVKKWVDLAPDHNADKETIPQLMGIEPSYFQDTMTAIHQEFGIEHFNWNLGCPMGPIVRKRRGCGLMPFPDDVERVVDAACRLPFRFSVKMRLGMHSVNEGLEIIRRLNDYPLEFVVVHPRLGDQQYQGKTDLNALREILSITRHRLVYSGDINTDEDFQMLQQRFPQINDWMLGRGQLRNPFLAEQIKGLSSSSDLMTRFNEFYEDLSQTTLHYRSKPRSLSVMKELWHYFASFFHLTDEELHSLLVIQDWDEFQQKVPLSKCR